MRHDCNCICYRNCIFDLVQMLQSDNKCNNNINHEVYLNTGLQSTTLFNSVYRVFYKNNISYVYTK